MKNIPLDYNCKLTIINVPVMRQLNILYDVFTQDLSETGKRELELVEMLILTINKLKENGIISIDYIPVNVNKEGTSITYIDLDDFIDSLQYMFDFIYNNSIPKLKRQELPKQEINNLESLLGQGYNLCQKIFEINYAKENNIDNIQDYI